MHSGNYCFTERELPKIKAAGVPISFDFSDDSTDEYFEQIAPFVTYAFMSMGRRFPGGYQGEARVGEGPWPSNRMRVAREQGLRRL